MPETPNTIEFANCGSEKLLEAAKVPSKLIRLAISDLKKCYVAANLYEIQMGVWYLPKTITYSEKCQVCLAGSVMAQTLGHDPDVEIWTIRSIPRQLVGIMLALDALRTGDHENFLGELDMETEADLSDCPQPYDWADCEEIDEVELFFKRYEDIAQWYEDKGL